MGFEFSNCLRPPDKIVQFPTFKQIDILKFILLPHWEKNKELHEPAPAIGASIGGQFAGIHPRRDIRPVRYWLQVTPVVFRIFMGAVMAHCHWKRVKLLNSLAHLDLTLSAPVIPEPGFDLTDKAHISSSALQPFAISLPSYPLWKCR